MTTENEDKNPSAGQETASPALSLEDMAKPTLKAFITCDRIADEGGKKSCVGIFDAISSPFFPVVHPRMFVYLILFAGLGEWDFGISLHDPDDNEIFAHQQKVRLRSNATTDLAFEFQGLPLHAPGTYWFQIRLGNEEFCEFPLTVSQLPGRPDYTPAQIKDLMANPDVIKHVRAELTCPNCGDKPVFQMNLDPGEPYPEEVLAFPDQDEFTCSKCHQSYDISGARLQMKYILGTVAPPVNA